MARVLHREPEFGVLGLVPIERNVGVTSAALQLAVAIRHLSARPVALIDCNTTAPAWSRLPNVKASRREVDTEVLPGISIVGQMQASPGVDFGWCRDAIGARTERGHFVMCDLTGLAETGALGRLYAYLHGVVSVVRAGSTFEWRLTALHRQFPRHLDRGVLFIKD